MFGSGVIAENFEVFENDIFDCKVLWMVGKGECRFLRSVKFVVRSLGRYLGRGVCVWLQRSQVAAFFEKLAHLTAFVVKVGAVTAEASQSEKLREWDGIYVLWMRGRM